MHAYEMEDRDAISTRWVVLFVLVSLLIHAVAALVLVLFGKLTPPVPIHVLPAQPTTLSLTLQQPPPQPKQKPIFMPTSPQANVKPKNTLIESDNDTNLTSKSKTSRKNDSIMPDVESKTDRSSQLENSPSSSSNQKPQQATPPAQKQEQQPPKEQPKEQPQQQPTPPQPQQPTQQAQKTPPQQAPPTQQPPPAAPQKATPSKTPPPPQLDENGLPVLPTIIAPTMAPPVSPAAAAAAQRAQAAVPPPLLGAQAANIQGRAGLSGAPSPEAMATELGRYKAKVYRAVGSRWYQKVGQQLQILPIGVVRIRYTIHSDGTVDTQVLEGNSGALQLLMALSLNSITESAPFDPFPPALIKQIGDSYTDEFSFSIYGGG